MDVTSCSLSGVSGKMYFWNSYFFAFSFRYPWHCVWRGRSIGHLKLGNSGGPLIVQNECWIYFVNTRIERMAFDAAIVNLWENKVGFFYWTVLVSVSWPCSFHQHLFLDDKSELPVGYGQWISTENFIDLLCNFLQQHLSSGQWSRLFLLLVMHNIVFF
jgi:hypothetical protein